MVAWCRCFGASRNSQAAVFSSLASFIQYYASQVIQGVACGGSPFLLVTVQDSLCELAIISFFSSWQTFTLSPVSGYSERCF